MTNDLEFETDADEAGPAKQWGLHNAVVVLAALGLVALSILFDVVRSAVSLPATPVWVDSFLSSVGVVLMLAAGSVIGMLVATRMLQAHVGADGARRLMVWGIVALAVSVFLQAGLFMVDLGLQDAGRPLIFAALSVSNFITGTMAVGAAMIALAFVGRLRR